MSWPPDDLAVSLARMAEHDTEQMRPLLLAAGSNDRRPFAEVHLGFVTRRAFHPPERERSALAQTPHEAPHTVIFSIEAVLPDEVLVDALGR